MTPQHTQDKPTLVLGGTGKTGRRVVERLTARGLPVRVGSRSGTPPFDWEDRSTWAPALDGVGSVYLTYYPDIAVPGAVEAVGSFAELAVRSGVPRLALLSGRGEPEAERAERAVRDTGADLTILRSTWFMQNFSEDYMVEHVLSGEIRLPAGDVPTPFLDADDIADVAVAALTDDRHVGQLYELTGTRSLTMADAAAEIAAGGGPRDPLRAGLARGARGRSRRARRAARVRGASDLPVRRGRGRPQCRHDGRRTARPRPRGAGLRRLRARGRRDRRLERVGDRLRRETMDDLLVALTLVTALGCGLSAGALFAFSSFVMRALARLPAAQGIAAMQSINVVAVTPGVHDGAVRHRRGLRGARGLGARRLARLVRSLAARRQRALSRRPDRADDGVPRAAQQRARAVEPTSPDAEAHWGAMWRNGRAGTTSGWQRA